MDINNIIIQYIFNNSQITNYNWIKKIYLVFGRSHPLFIKQVKTYFFNTLYNQYGVTNIDDLLTKLIVRGTARFFPCYIQFKRNPTHLFENLCRRSRLILKYLCLYHDYLYVFCGKRVGESHGPRATADTYSACHVETKPLFYRLLKQKRIHNLEYYDLVSKGPTFYDHTYILKQDFVLYKAGVTSEFHDAICIKI